MPAITLPEHLKMGVDNAFSNQLYRRIGRGQVDAVLTCENDANNTRSYVLEFKTFDQTKRLKFWKKVLKPDTNAIALAFSGHIGDAGIGRPVELKLASHDQEEAAAELLGMSNYSLKLYSTPLEEKTQQRVRVELTPHGKRPVYMALEAQASFGEPVQMQQGFLFQSEATLRPTGETDESATAQSGGQVAE